MTRFTVCVNTTQNRVSQRRYTILTSIASRRRPDARSSRSRAEATTLAPVRAGSARDVPVLFRLGMDDRGGRRAGLRRAAGLLARRPWRPALGRHRTRHDAGAAAAGRPVADLVPGRRDAAGPSAAALRVLAGAPPLGRPHDRLSPGQPLTPPRLGAARGSHRAPASAPGHVAGGRDLRAASGAGRVRGVDHRAEEHAFDGLLSGLGARLSRLRSHPKPGPVPVGVGAVRLRGAQQDLHRDAAGRAARRHLVAAWPPALAQRRGAARTLADLRRGSRLAHRLGRAPGTSAPRARTSR